MDPVDFGKLIASLRKEHEDEEDVPWTQEKLAEESNKTAGVELFSGDIVSAIERGKRNLDQQTLLALADALQLTSGERKEFFLASSGIDNERIARPDHDPEEVLDNLLQTIRQSYLPAYVVDSYCDVVAVNFVDAEGRERSRPGSGQNRTYLVARYVDARRGGPASHGREDVSNRVCGRNHPAGVAAPETPLDEGQGLLRLRQGRCRHQQAGSSHQNGD